MQRSLGISILARFALLAGIVIAVAGLVLPMDQSIPYQVLGQPAAPWLVRVAHVGFGVGLTLTGLGLGRRMAAAWAAYVVGTALSCLLHLSVPLLRNPYLVVIDLSLLFFLYARRREFTVQTAFDEQVAALVGPVAGWSTGGGRE